MSKEIERSAVANEGEVFSAICDYLDNGLPSSALMLQGPWGCGKTYFVRNSLDAMLREAGYKYSTVYVSVFGLSKPEDIFGSIMIANGGGSQIAVRAFRTLTGAVGVIEHYLTSGASLAEQLGSFTESQMKSRIDLSNKLICIDDIERSSVQPDEILGYIYSYLVEHASTKFLIVGNEEEMSTAASGRDGEKSNYKRYKEKIVGRTLDYRANLRMVVDSHIAPDAKLSYIKECLIEQCVKIGVENYRTVAYIISILDTIQKCVLDDEIPDPVVYFTALMAHEYKMGNILAVETVRGYSQMNEVIRMLVQSEREHSDGGEAVRYYRKYIESNPGLYRYYESIAKYVVSGILDKQLLGVELKENKDKGETIKKLHLVREMEDEELESLLDAVALEIHGNIYSPYDLLSFVDYLEWLSFQGVITETRALSLHDTVEKAARQWGEDISRTDLDWGYDSDLYSDRAKNYRERMKELYKNKKRRMMDNANKMAVELLLTASLDQASYDNVCRMEMSEEVVELIVERWLSAKNKGRKLLSHALISGIKQKIRGLARPEYELYGLLLDKLNRGVQRSGKIGRMLTLELIQAIREQLEKTHHVAYDEQDVASVAENE